MRTLAFFTLQNLIICTSYDDSCITFIATKTDDVSCSEIVNALNLEDDPVLQEIEAEMYKVTEEMGALKSQKIAADKKVKSKLNAVAY